MTVNIYRETLDSEKYVLVDYYLRSPKGLGWCAWQLGCGQSVSNPNMRSKYEDDKLFENHACMILGNEEELNKKTEGIVTIGFPVANTNWSEDGVSHFMTQILGGQADINFIEGSRVVDIRFPECVEKSFKGPRQGIKGIREFTGVYDKPLLGGIIKPKTGVPPEILFKMVEEMMENGCNFIKEDEIMSNPDICPFKERVKILAPLFKRFPKTIYSFCINSDYPYVFDRAKYVADHGGNSVHINFWNGLGVYKSIRELDLPLFIHFQKSGDKVITDKRNPFSISWPVLCDLAGYSGVDFIHAGMLKAGYSSSDEVEMKDCLARLWKHGVMPALSCGMVPGAVESIRREIGDDWMANVGAGLHSHEGGTGAGVRAMRQAIDRDHKEEYEIAIRQWGLIN